MEWFQLLGRYNGHDADDRFLRILIGDFLIRDWKRPEPLVLANNDLSVVQFVAFQLEYVEIESSY